MKKWDIEQSKTDHASRLICYRYYYHLFIYTAACMEFGKSRKVGHIFECNHDEWNHEREVGREKQQRER